MQGIHSLASRLSFPSGSFVRPRAGSAVLLLEGLDTRTQKRKYISTKNSLSAPVHSQRPQRTSSRREARGQKQQAAHELHALKAALIGSTGLTPNPSISLVAGLSLVRPHLQSACQLPEV